MTFNAISQLPQPAGARLEFRIKFEEPCKVVGPDWIMSPGLLRSESRGAILAPCVASFEQQSVEFEWPGFINTEGMLTLDELPEELRLHISRSLNILSLRDRVRDVRSSGENRGRG